MNIGFGCQGKSRLEHAAWVVRGLAAGPWPAEGGVIDASKMSGALELFDIALGSVSWESQGQKGR